MKDKMDFYIFNNCTYDAKWLSGSDRRVYEWSRIYKQMGHNVTIFIHRAIFKRYEDKGFNILVTSNLNYKKWGILFAYIWNAIKGCLLQDKKVQKDSIIYSSSDAIPDVLPAIVMKLRNKEAFWIAGLHLIAPSPFKGFKKVFGKGFRLPTIRGSYYYYTQKVIVFVMKHFTQLIMVSNNIDKKFLINKGIPSDKIMVVYGGVNFNEVKEAKGEPKYDACFIGRIHPQKGIPDLLETWSKVCQKKKDAKLALIGQLEALKDEVYRKGLHKNVDFWGFLDGIRKFQVLKSSRLFLLPSYYEGCALVVCEAMACELPVVAYDLPMLREVYPQGMVRVPLGDIERFSQEIITLLNDEQMRKRILEEAKELSSLFDWEKSATRIIDRLADMQK